MSQKCERLHGILKEGKKLYAPSLDDARAKKELNHLGLYVFYEKGETGHGGDRIVRVGRAISSSKLLGRIRKHFRGKKDYSVFRKQIGRAVLCDEPERLANWNIKREANGYKPDDETEEKVSQYLAENCYCIAISIDDIEKVKELEKKMTATVAQCKECKPSKNWFGYRSPKAKIKEYGLWSVQDLEGEELSDDDLYEIEKHLIKA